MSELASKADGIIKAEVEQSSDLGGRHGGALRKVK